MIEESDPQANQTNNPSHTSDPQPAIEPAEQPSPKAASNRHNAQQSTGPKTAQGKAWSRLNALKHGILASQAVIATIEGAEERRMFEETVEGLNADFEPVGTEELLLVQEVAACFWRKRRMLRFENDAAFRVIERRQRNLIARNPLEDAPPVYSVNDEYEQLEGVMEKAGLDGITLPGQADTMLVIRYEAGINRIKERATARLEVLRERRERLALNRQSKGGAPAASEPEEKNQGAIDPGPEVRREGRGAYPLPVEESLGLHEDLVDSAQSITRDKVKAEREAGPEAQLEKLEKIQRLIYENYQTKPKTPVVTETSSATPSIEADETAPDPSKMKPPTG